MDVIIPTFVNAHLFWIVPKRDMLLRSAMNTLMTHKGCRVKKKDEEVREGEMLCFNIDGVWVRAILEDIITVQDESDEVKYLCWLPDYGVMRCVGQIFHIPDDLQHCPSIAQKASLYNVVNLTTDLVLGAAGYEFQLTKTLEDVPGVRKIATDFLESAEKTLFSLVDEGRDIAYGDIVCLDRENTENSLNDFLIKRKLIAPDEDMFRTAENKRFQFKEAYFQNSASWNQPLDKTNRHVSEIIFNKDKTRGMDFFKGTKDSNRL